MFSDVVTKVNSHQMKQDRWLALTTINIYNLKRKSTPFMLSHNVTEIRRVIPISAIRAVIKNQQDKYEFVLHVPSEYDYRFLTQRRDEFIQILQLRFVNLNPNLTLKIFGVVSLTPPSRPPVRSHSPSSARRPRRRSKTSRRPSRTGATASAACPSTSSA